MEFIDDQGEYELGYMISGKYARQGYAKETVKAILEYAEEELEAPRVVLQIHKENQASLNFAKKMGFKHIEEKDLEDRRLFIYEL